MSSLIIDASPSGITCSVQSMSSASDDYGAFVKSFWRPGAAPRGKRGPSAAFDPTVSALDATGRAGSSDSDAEGDESGSSRRSDHFSVAVRVRPPIALERARRGNLDVVKTDGAQRVWIDGKASAKYTFNHVFGPESTQHEVYERCVSPCVDAVVGGINATVMAYGVTSSGKTYTMLGDGAHGSGRGVIPRAVAGLFDKLRARGVEFTITASFVQIFNDALSDLLLEGGGGPLRLRESGAGDSGVYVEGLSQVRINGVEEALRLIEVGAASRHTSATAMNETSSRSHAVFTLTVTTTDCEHEAGAGRSGRQSCLNLVDLAGSERVALTGNTGAKFKEGVAINQSLQALANVITALTERKGGTRRGHIPYRDSKLTRLLQRSLGGNCRTTVLANVSPAEFLADDTARTLRFACRATYVSTFARVNTTVDGRPIGASAARGGAGGASAGASGAKFTASELEKLESSAERAAKAATEHGEGFFNSYVAIPHKKKGVLCYAQCFGNRVDAPLVVLLHGYPSDSTAWEYMAPPLVKAGYRVALIDFPGFGRSPGDRLNPRSEANFVDGGPVECVLATLDHFGVPSAVIMGYDWGGGVAVSVAHKYRKRVSKLILYHSTYSEQKSELSKIKTKTLLLWRKTDQFHPYKWARTLEKKLVNSTLKTLATKKSRVGHVRGDEVVDTVTGWLGHATGADGSDKDESAAAAETTDASTGADERKSVDSSEGKGSEGVAVFGIEGKDDADDSSGVSEAEAVAEFRKLWRAGDLPRYYGAVIGKGDTSLKPTAIRLFSSLPIVSPHKMPTPAHFVAAGLWATQPNGWDEMARSPRYFPGRQVCVRARGVNERCTSGQDYLAFDPAKAARSRSAAAVSESKADLDTAFVTHRAVIVGPASTGGDRVEVAVPAVGGGSATLDVPLSAVLSLNQPHTFPPTSGWKIDETEGLSLEDGVRLTYGDLLTRARLCEIALALDSIVVGLDFAAEDASHCTEVQERCVTRIRKVLNITRLQDGVDRRREARMQSWGRLVTYGQGHCHGLSSTMAGALHTFSHVLGIDVRYRRGYVLSSAECDSDGVALPTSSVSNKYDRHHWLELTYRPACTSVTCDLSFEGRRGAYFLGHTALSQPVELTYSLAGGQYPNGTVPDFARSKAATSTDVRLDARRRASLIGGVAAASAADTEGAPIGE